MFSLGFILGLALGAAAPGWLLYRVANEQSVGVLNRLFYSKESSLKRQKLAAKVQTFEND